MTRYHTVEQGKYGLKEERQNGRTKLYFISEIINPLFDGLTYNTCGHFAHGSYFSTPLRGSEKYYALSKYPRVLYAKPSNKVYIITLKQQKKRKEKHSTNG